MTRLPAELPGNGFNQSLPQFGSAPFNRITLFWSHLSNFFFADFSLHNQRLPQKYIVWIFLFSKEKTTKTEERADYCQHFIYMKVLQKAVKKIACGFPQLLPQPGGEKTLPEAQRTQKLTPRLGLNLATTWRHLHQLQIWPPDDATWLFLTC